MWRRRILPAGVAIVLGSVTLVASIEGARTDRDSATEARARVLNQATHATEILSNDLESRVSDLAGLFNASQNVDPDEFSAFTEPMLSTSGSSELSWIELVPGAARTAHERRLGFPLLETTADGKSVTAKARSQYAVTTYVKTPDDSEATIGTDVLADPVRAAAIQRAAETASPHATGRVLLRGASEPGFVMYIPAFGPTDAPTALRKPIGFVSAAFRFEDLHTLLENSVPRGAHAELRVDGVVVVSIGRQQGQLQRSPLLVSGQRWSVAVSAAPIDRAFLGLSRAAAAATVLGLITLLLTGLTWQAVVGASRSEELAALRQHERDQAIRERESSEQATRALLGHLPDLAVLRFDADLRITSAKGGLLSRTGWSSEEMEGHLITELFGGPDGERLAAPMRAALAGTPNGFSFDGIRDSSFRYWMQTLPLVGDTPGGLLVASNVTDLMDAHVALESAERRFERAFDGAPVGMALINGAGEFVQVNEAMCAITGLPADELEGSKPAVITHEEDREAASGHLLALLEGRTTTVTAEQRYIHADGKTVWVAAHSTILTDSEGNPDLVLSQVLDVTDRRQAHDQLQHLADHDALTGLRNRRSFEQALETQIACVRRYGPEGALLMLDLDHFKSVNDTLGHQAGDEVLSAAANALRCNLRASDTVGRLGGDEFAVLLPKADEQEARTVAKKLGESIRAVGKQLHGDAGGSAVTASIGIVVLSVAHEDCVGALADADRAMYEAKSAGRDGYAVAGLSRPSALAIPARIRSEQPRS